MFEISKVNRERGHQHQFVMKQSRTRLWQPFFCHEGSRALEQVLKGYCVSRHTGVLQNATGQTLPWERSSLQIFMQLDKCECLHCPL